MLRREDLDLIRRGKGSFSGKETDTAGRGGGGGGGEETCDAKGSLLLLLSGLGVGSASWLVAVEAVELGNTACMDTNPRGDRPGLVSQELL